MKIFVALSAMMITASAGGQTLLATGTYSNLDVKKPGAAVETEQTLVNGDYVKGNPFLLDEWLPGQITLEDGRVYNGYKIKYDILNQKLLFLDKNVSMDVVDPVKEFSIQANAGTTRSFINAGIYDKSKKGSFFEMLINGAVGQLFKLSEKSVSRTSDLSINMKNLSMDQSYFFYDISSNKLLKLKSGTSSNVSAGLKLSTADKQALGWDSYTFDNELSLIKFINAYITYKSN